MQFNFIFLIIFSYVLVVFGQVYPQPCPIPSESLLSEKNFTKLIPSPLSSLPVIEKQFYNKPIIKPDDKINNYKPKTLLQFFNIQNI
jgi:hypothetical protein